MSETNHSQELRTVKVIRTVTQIATVNILASKDKSIEEVVDQLIGMAREGQIDHLWRDVNYLGIDPHYDTFNASVSKPGTVPSILYSPECVKFIACARAMRIEKLRNVYNAQIDPSSSDETEGFRVQTDIACMLADMMNWCEFFNVDFETAISLAASHFKQERDEA